MYFQTWPPQPKPLPTAPSLLPPIGFHNFLADSPSPHLLCSPETSLFTGFPAAGQQAIGFFFFFLILSSCSAAETGHFLDSILLRNFLETSQKLLRNFLETSQKLLRNFLEISQNLLRNLLETPYFFETSYKHYRTQKQFRLLLLYKQA